MSRIGLAFTGQPYSIPQIVDAGRSAEQAGFDSVWTAEDHWTGRDGMGALSCLAFTTERIRLGTCVINPYNRHPALMAMALNSLSDLAADRLILGIGAGMRWKPLLEAEYARRPPLLALRETTTMIRAVFAGRTVPWGDEAWSLDAAQTRPLFSGPLPFRPQRVPIYVGGRSPRTMRLIGEIGDGVIHGTGTTREDLVARDEQLAAGARNVGRDPAAIDVAALLVASASSGGRLHPNILRSAAGHAATLDDAQVTSLGFDPERIRRLRIAWQNGSHDAAFNLLTPDMVARIAVAGTPEQCLKSLALWVAAGVTTPILFAYGGELAPLIEIGAEFLRQQSQRGRTEGTSQ